MLDAKKAEVNTVGGGGQVEKVVFADINPCTESDDYGDFTIEYPYEVTLKDSKGKEILKEKSQGTLRAKNWAKKFYIKESATGNEYIAYSRYTSLLAIVTIKTKMVGELPAKLNLNDLVGFEFDAVVVELDSGERFIDWVGTFEANGVEVPTVEDLRVGTTTKKVDIKEARESFNKKGAW